MSKLALVKHQSGILIPANDECIERIERVPVGEVLVGEFKKARNGGHHRKLFALLGIMFDNQGRFANREDMLVDVKVKCGHYREYITNVGEVVYVPKSIAYGEMDQVDFEAFYPKVVQLSLTDPTYLRGLSIEELDREISRRLLF